MKDIPYGKGRASKADMKVPVLKLLRGDPALAALVSKMETARIQTPRDPQGGSLSASFNQNLIRNILGRRSKKNAEAAAMLKLLPDNELSIQILTSSILSPQDMTSTDLNYQSDSDVFSPALTGRIIDEVRKYFTKERALSQELTTILRESLFEKGAYPIAVLPENAIDELINGDLNLSTESLKFAVNEKGEFRNMGILGPRGARPASGRRGIIFEDLAGADINDVNRPGANLLQYTDEDNKSELHGKPEEYLVVCDNPAVLRVGAINQRLRERAVKAHFNKATQALGMEAYGNANNRDLENLLFRTRSHQASVSAELKPQSALRRKSIGEALIKKFPSESVFPAHIPGDPSNHLGFFVILDENGHAVDTPDHGFSAIGATNDSLQQGLIRKVAANLGVDSGNLDLSSVAHTRMMAQFFADMVERDLVERVKNGVHSMDVQIANNQNGYELMLSRVLAKKFTQILYIPAEYMTYIAFKYDDNGIGRSFLDDQAMIQTLRIVLMFTDLMAGMRNSIGRTKVSMQLDEKTPNPMKAIETAVDEFIRTRSISFPDGVPDPRETVDYIQRAGWEFEFTGHPGLPDTKIETQQTQSSHPRVDSETTDSLRKMSIMAYGLSPETVDQGYAGEFATTAVANNILLSKRVMAWQDQFTPQISRHVRQVMTHSEKLMKRIRKLIEEDPEGVVYTIPDEELQGHTIGQDQVKKLTTHRAIGEFIGSLNATLPRPNTITLEKETQDLETYSEAVDKVLDNYFSSDLFTQNTAGNLGEQTANLKALYKSHYIRKWIAQRNFMPELAEILDKDEEGNNPIVTEIRGFIERISQNSIALMAELKPNATAVNKDSQALGLQDTGGSAASSDSGSSAGSGDDFGFGGDDAFGGEMPEDDSESETPEAPPDGTAEASTTEPVADPKDPTATP